jgi:hypothetical protein
MKVPCENASKYLLPSIRALIAKKLIENYNFTQQNAASKLGMTQSAMSKYLREKRGAIANTNEEINKLTDDVAKSLYEGRMSPDEFVEKLCRICFAYRNDATACMKRQSN